MAKKDLKPVRSKEEAKSRGKKGGIASGVSRREKKTLRQRLELLLAAKDAGSGNDIADDISLALIQEALGGNVKAYEVIRDTLGEKPTDKVKTNISGNLVVKWQSSK